MSKHLGNILEPMPLMERHGADAVRWFMLAGGSPWSARRVGHKVLEEIASKVLRTYWSIASFQSLYARANDWTPGARRPAGAADRRCWTGGRGPRPHRVAAEVDAALEDYDAARAGRALAGPDRRPVQLVRPPVPAPVLGRRPGRAADPARLPGDADPAAGAVRAVHHRDGSGGRCSPSAPASSRCTWRRWPATRRSRPTPQLSRAGGAGPAAGRARPGGPGGVGGQDPAAAGPGADLGARAGTSCRPSCGAEVADELNVVELAELASAEDLVNVTVKPNFRALGKRFGTRTKEVAAAISAGRSGRASPPRCGPGGTARTRRVRTTIDRRGRDRQRGAGVGLGGRDRGLGHGRAGPGADRRSCAGWARCATWSGSCRRRARTPASRSPTGSSCTGGSAAHPSRPRRSASTPTSWPARCWPATLTEGAPAGGRLRRHQATDEELGLHLWLTPGLTAALSQGRRSARPGRRPLARAWTPERDARLAAGR